MLYLIYLLQGAVHHTNSLVIMEGVYLKAMSVMGIMTVVITVMNKDVVYDREGN